MEINTLLPHSSQVLLDEMVHLREDRDNYSGLHDAMMNNVSKQLQILCPTAFTTVYTASLFPERIAEIACRLAEEYIIKNNLVPKQ